jgi:Amt family ammonium transporter
MGSLVAYAFVSKKPDLSMGLNGILAGLVGITAGADVIAPLPSIAVGFMAGAIVVYAVMLFDKLKIDDPVGATSVHLVCGVFGTLMVGVFGEGKSLGAQAIGVAAYGAFTVVASVVIFGLVKATMGLRVDAEEEIEGLDAGEHGMQAYVLDRGAMQGHGLAPSPAAETASAGAALAPVASEA